MHVDATEVRVALGLHGRVLLSSDREPLLPDLDHGGEFIYSSSIFCTSSLPRIPGYLDAAIFADLFQPLYP